MNLDYSIIIPAYNEEHWLPKSLPAAQTAIDVLDAQGEIIVVDNNSSDRTSKVAQAHGVQVIFEPINQISRARNAGARAAKGRYLVFIDADTIVSSALLSEALDNLAQGDCCGGGTLVAWDRPCRFVYRMLISLWNWGSVRHGTAAGCFIYCLREAFDQINGFSEKVYASEELWLSRSLRSWGRKRNMDFKIITRHPAVTSTRKLNQPLRIMFWLPVYFLFPFAVRFRVLCSLWYSRADA